MNPIYKKNYEENIHVDPLTFPSLMRYLGYDLVEEIEPRPLLDVDNAIQIYRKTTISQSQWYYTIFKIINIRYTKIEVRNTYILILMMWDKYTPNNYQSNNKVIKHHLLFDKIFLNSCNSTLTIVISSWISLRYDILLRSWILLNLFLRRILSIAASNTPFPSFPTFPR